MPSLRHEHKEHTHTHTSGPGLYRRASGDRASFVSSDTLDEWVVEEEEPRRKAREQMSPVAVVREYKSASVTPSDSDGQVKCRVGSI
jgi:hypothetical protein